MINISPSQNTKLYGIKKIFEEIVNLYNILNIDSISHTLLSLRVLLFYSALLYLLN